MKRLLALLGIFALLSTVFVLATASPSSAGQEGPVQWEIKNRGEDAITISSLTGCNPLTKTPFDIPGGESAWAQFDPSGNCEATAVAQDADLQCVMYSGRPDGGDNGSGSATPQYRDPIEVRNWVSGPTMDTAYFATGTGHNECVADRDLHINKGVVNYQREYEFAQADLTTFNFGIEAWGGDSLSHDGAAPGSACAASNQTVSTTGPAGPDDHLDAVVLNGYLNVAENSIVPCVYRVYETVPAGWELIAVNNDSVDNLPIPVPPLDDNVCIQDSDIDTASVLYRMMFRPEVNPADEGHKCSADFLDLANPVPIIVTKTFIGRSYYTTVDRADFHVFTPGNCSGIPIDPFGNLLGSNGLFRTVNAAQDTQFVIAPPFTSDALPTANAWTAGYDLKQDPVKCTTRVQETHVADGCTPLDPDGSNADGPYWEQTWDIGVTNLTFNIVNDCTEPTPEPTVAPTTDPKKPAAKPGAKKPSGGGSTAPKFTG